MNEGSIGIAAGLAVLAIASCGPAVPTADACVRSWNRDPPTVPGNVTYTTAIAWGFITKADTVGCAVVVVEGTRGAWASFSGDVDSRYGWDRVSGERWGQDSPEGGPTEFNATLEADGRLTLEP